MLRKLAPLAAAAAVLGVVGGVYIGTAHQPAAQPAQVQFVQPAAQVVTPEATTAPRHTTTTAAPKPVAKPKPAPKPVATVNSVAPAPAPATVQKEIVVADPTPTAPEVTPTAPAAAPTRPSSNLPPLPGGDENLPKPTNS